MHMHPVSSIFSTTFVLYYGSGALGRDPCGMPLRLVPLPICNTFYVPPLPGDSVACRVIRRSTAFVDVYAIFLFSSSIRGACLLVFLLLVHSFAFDSFTFWLIFW
jgi:hypothetical protein